MQPAVGQIMSENVRTLRTDQSLLVAWNFLRKQKVRHIPIVEGGKLVGVVTDRDVKKATPSRLDADQEKVWLRSLGETPLTRVMTPAPLTATPETSLREALEVLVKKKIGCLPVMQNGDLVGIITAQDLLRATLGMLDGSD